MERLFIFFCDGLIYALMILVCHGCIFFFTEEANNSPRTRYPDGSTCLHQAHSIEQAASLIRRGAEVNAQTEHGRTPLHHALYYHTDSFDLEQLQMTQLLLMNGAEVNIQDEDGKTPLHILFEGNHYKPHNHPVSQEVLLTLLRAGADIHLKDKQGKSALDCAPNEATREYMLRWENDCGNEEFWKMLCH